MAVRLLVETSERFKMVSAYSFLSARLRGILEAQRAPSNVKIKVLKHRQSKVEKDPSASCLWAWLFGNRVDYNWIHRKSTRFLNGCTTLD